MYWAFFAIVLFASLAMMVREGIWSNAISLVNIIISGLVAFGFYAPLTIYIDEKLDGEYTYVLDFVVIWGLFVITMIVLRAVTGAASRTRLRFKNPIDPVGGPLVGFLAAWVLMSFAMATLHVSPMSKDSFSGKLLSSNVDSASAFTSPDVAWLRFVDKMSAPEALGTATTERFPVKPWVQIQEDHRTKYQTAPSVRVTRG